MSSRGRIVSFVALAAAIASGAVVAGVLGTRGHVPGTPDPRSGHPPLVLAFGVRVDAEVRALERADRLYREKRYDAAGRIFGRYRSLEAQVGAALVHWPGGTLSRLQDLRAEHPRSALVALHAGLALYWARQDDDAIAAWRAAARNQPDTPYAVRAGDFLHPRYAPGLPPFVPSFEPSRRIRVLPGPQQFAALRDEAARGGAHAKILYGTALQRVGRPVSAERQFAAAARVAPADPEARVAAAVGLFDKGKPERAFGRLGPLTRVFADAQTVRFHLGLLLVWSAQVDEARNQLRLAQSEDPQSPLGREAARYLGALKAIGTR